MEFRFSQQVPLPAAEVVALMGDEPFQAEKAARLGAQAFEMSTETGPGGTSTVRTHRTLPTVGLPEFVKALVRPVMVVTETERWEAAAADGSRRGAFEIDVEGAPVRFRGVVAVLPALPVAGAEASTLTFEGTLTSTVPLFRARVEEASAAQIRETMEVECAVLAERAARGESAA